MQGAEIQESQGAIGSLAWKEKHSLMISSAHYLEGRKCPYDAGDDNTVTLIRAYTEAEDKALDSGGKHFSTG